MAVFSTDSSMDELELAAHTWGLHTRAVLHQKGTCFCSKLVPTATIALNMSRGTGLIRIRVLRRKQREEGEFFCEEDDGQVAGASRSPRGSPLECTCQQIHGSQACDPAPHPVIEVANIVQ